MAEREYVARAERRIEAHPSLVWALVADTNRFDRAVGLTPGEYSFEEVPGGRRVPVARAKQLGFEIVWREPPYEWVEGRSVRGFRQFIKGPLSRGGFEVTLTPDGTGTRMSVRIFIAGDTFALRIAGPVTRAQIQRGITRYLDAIEKVLTRASLNFVPGTEPPASLARRALMQEPIEQVASGTVSPTNASEIEHRGRRLSGAPIDAKVTQRLLSFLGVQSDDEVSQMRPFEIARAWGVDPREALRVFLYAARAGLVDLNWQLNCPTCRVASEVEDSLSKVGRQGHCEACNISFDLDFARHVEAVFRVNAAVRETQSAMYCASSPWFRPHVFSQLGVEPHAKETFDAPFPIGSLLFRTLIGQRSAVINEHDDTALPPEKITVTIMKESLAVEVTGQAEAGKNTSITIDNQTDERVLHLIERAGWNADIVRGSVITTLPDFVDLFATEAPASGVDLTVGSLTLLFTDLTGSTAMYERIGDARAFAIVQEHFRLLTESAAAHRGAIVKTMGDAIMASFASPSDALLAAIEMVEKTAEAHGSVGLTVKIGLQEGPCLAVRANERLDFFGTTVNVAARLQAQAHPSEIVLMKELTGHPEIAKILARRHFPSREFEASLKGIREAQQLIAFDAEPGRALASGTSIETKSTTKEAVA